MRSSTCSAPAAWARSIAPATRKLGSRRRDQDPAGGVSQPTPSGSRASSAKRGCSPRSIIPTSRRSTASRSTDGMHALVLELVEGADARRDRRHARPAALPVDEALAIARQIADALEAAHETRHRASRPEAGQRQGHRRRHRQGARLRPGQGDGSARRRCVDAAICRSRRR